MAELKEIEEIIMDDDSDEELDDEMDPLVLEEENEPEEVDIRFRCRRPGDSGNILEFTPPYTGINKMAAPNINANSSPLTIFTLFFEEIFTQLLCETNRYFHQFCASQEVPGPSTKQSDVTFIELYKFLALIIQMGHDQRDTIKDYWSKEEQYYTPFYHNHMSRDRFLHILRFIHFADNSNPPNKEDPDYDRLWKFRKIFDTLNNKFSEYYYPTENIAIDEVRVLFKGKIIFRQYIPKKHKRFGIKMYKLSDSLGYTYDMSVYLGKQKQLANEDITAIQGTVFQLVRKVEGVGHKLYMDDYFSSPQLFDTLLKRKINSCGTVSYNRREMPHDIRPNYIKLKRGDIITRVRGNLSAIRWKDKRDMYLLTNMHSPPLEGNFVDEFGNAIKPKVIQDYNTHMGYVDKSDRMVNSYGITRKTWKWTKKLFFHLVDITILNAYLLHKSVKGNLTHKKFRETLVKDLITKAQELNVTSTATSSGRPSPTAGQLSRLELRHSKHWPSKCNSPRRCRVCSTKNKVSRTLYYCEKCNVGLCVVDCFAKWHTHVKF